MLNLYSDLDLGYVNAMEFLTLNKYEIVHFHSIVADKEKAVEEFESYLKKKLKNETNYVNIISAYEYTKYKNENIGHYVFVYAVTPVPIKDKSELSGEDLVYNESINLDSIEDYEPLPDYIMERLKEATAAMEANELNPDDGGVIHIDNEFQMQMKRDEISENIAHALADDGQFKPIAIKLTDEQMLRHVQADRDFYRAAYMALAKLHRDENEEV